MADAIDPRQLPATTQIPQAPMPAQPPQVQSMEDAAVAASQAGTQAFGQDVARQQQLAQQIQQLQQQRANVGPLSYQPHMAPIHGQGFGHDLLNFLGNIGRGALTFGASTGPGQAIQSVAYSQPRQEYGKLTQQISEIQKQLGTVPEAESASAGMTARPMSAYGGLMRGTAAMSRADAEQYRAKVIGQARLKLEQQANDIRKALGEGKISAENARTRMMKAVADENNATKQNIANTITDTQLQNEQTRASEEDFKTMSDHLLSNLLGIAPSKPVTPAGGRPQQRNAQPQGKTGGMIYARDPSGKLHQAPAGTALPKGWKAEKRQ